MTVIAWDGSVLAADSMVTIGDVRVGSVEKVTLKRYADKSVLYAATGPAGWLDAWIEWIDAGEKPADRPWTALQPHRTGQIIRVMDGQASSMTPEHPYWTACDPLDAWGAGCDLAIGALEAGLDAVGAATIATRRSTACGGDVMAWYGKHPGSEPNERCICAECHEHFTTSEPEPVRHVVTGITGFSPSDYLAPSLSEMANAMSTDATCLSGAVKACDDGVDAIARADWAGAAHAAGDALTEPSPAMRSFIADRTPVYREVPLGKPVVVTELDDGLYLAKAQQAMRDRLTQLNDPATALRRHLDAQAALAAKVHEAIGVKAEMLRRGGVRANPGDKECIHGYVPHTCSTCSRSAQLAMAPGANGVVHEGERQGDSGVSRHNGAA